MSSSKERIKKNGILSNKSRIFTTNEKKLCTTDREVIGIINSPTKFETFKIRLDPFISVLKDHKPIHSCFTKKETFFPLLYSVQMQLANIQKLRKLYTTGKSLFVTDLTNRSFNREKLELNHLKQKELLSQIHSAILAQDKQIKPVNIYVYMRLYFFHERTVFISF